jgi:hypothetical protein
MSRQSISFTKPNDEWLKAQVDQEEYSSKSELVNDFIVRIFKTYYMPGISSSSIGLLCVPKIIDTRCKRAPKAGDDKMDKTSF